MKTKLKLYLATFIILILLSFTAVSLGVYLAYKNYTYAYLISIFSFLCLFSCALLARKLKIYITRIKKQNFLIQNGDAIVSILDRYGTHFSEPESKQLLDNYVNTPLDMSFPEYLIHLIPLSPPLLDFFIKETLYHVENILESVPLLKETEEFKKCIKDKIYSITTNALDKIVEFENNFLPNKLSFAFDFRIVAYSEIFILLDNKPFADLQNNSFVINDLIRLYVFDGYEKSMFYDSSYTSEKPNMDYLP